MKTSCTLLLAFVFALPRLAAAPINAPSKITAVTVYADRAIVTRVAQVDLPGAGPAEIAFEKLPANVLDDSLQVSGQGTAEATLLDVTARPVFAETAASDRVKALEEQLAVLGRDDRVLTDRSTALGEQRNYVLKIQSATTATNKESGGAPTSIEVWTKLLGFTDDQLGKIAAELRSVDMQRQDLQAKRTALEQQLNELRGQRERSTKNVVVRLTAAAPGSLQLTLRYALPDASWSASYDARVSSNAHTLKLGYFGLVRQNSGEDWTGIDLTLSTARPSFGGAAPELQPWVVQEEQPPKPLSNEPIQLSPFEVSAKRATAYRAASTLAGSRVSTELKDMASAVSTVETQASSATFRIPTKVDLPADNAPHKVGIADVSLKAELSYRTTPKLLPAAFLSASVTNSSDYPLLAGAMNVFLDDTFVASSRLRNVMPGEKFDLALGADEGISVERKLNNRFTEDTGLVSKGRRITYDATIMLQNHKQSAVTIVVSDQIPVSRHEKIEVKVQAPEAREAKPDAAGIINWTLTLQAGEKRALPLKFSVEYPADLPVTGLE